ncbi:MAG: Gfo/Idh/MocA family oxidoreductase [Pirellulales bacterium]
MSNKVHRRRFMHTTAATIGAGYFAAAGLQAQESKSPNEKIRFGCIGVGGKGSSDSDDAGRRGDVVAICDVDDKTLGTGSKRFEGAKTYYDFRKMLEENAKNIDAVTVSTPDHTHAPAALMAMRMGMHCFCQKPLAHSIYETRLMGKVAREKKLATQMGNQGTAESGLRHAAALLKKGILGNVHEVHIWTNRPIWPQGGERPPAKEPPERLHWDEWLSAAKERPYADGYHTFAWRGWWDFGTGALGDMACHTVNMPFMGLGLRDPISVQATTSGHNGDSYPKRSVITFEFGATEARPALTFTWYDGGTRPPKELLEGINLKGSGALIVGEKGKIYSPDDYGADFTVLGGPEKEAADYPKSPGHFDEWTRAIKGGEQAMSNFPDYAGPLAETILLGNLAVWAAPEKDEPGKKIEWDAKELKAKNAPEVAHVIKPEYRKGYTLDV